MQQTNHYTIENVSFSALYVFAIQDMQLALSHSMQTFTTSWN